VRATRPPQPEGWSESVTAAVVLFDGRVCRWLATPRCRGRASCRGVADLSGSLANRGAGALIGLAHGLRVVRRSRCRNIQALRLRGVHTAAHPDARERRKFPSQAWALLHSITSVTPHGRDDTEVPTQPCSVRGFVPCSVLPVARSHVAPAGSQPAGSVASPGFRTLSTLCSPRDLPGLFHPGSALGVTLRGLFPTWCRTPSRAPDPPGFRRSPSGQRLPLGDRAHHADPARGLRGLAGRPRRCLHGFVHSEASCGDQLRTELPVRLPSRAFPSRPRAGLPVGAPGSLLFTAQPLSLEIGVASMGFCTSSLSRLFGATPGLGYRFPSVPGPRRRRSLAPLRPSSRPCRSSSRQPFR
jgi:hypothetical protein